MFSPCTRYPEGKQGAHVRFSGAYARVPAILPGLWNAPPRPAAGLFGEVPGREEPAEAGRDSGRGACRAPGQPGAVPGPGPGPPIVRQAGSIRWVGGGEDFA